LQLIDTAKYLLAPANTRQESPANAKVSARH